MSCLKELKKIITIARKQNASEKIDGGDWEGKIKNGEPCVKFFPADNMKTALKCIEKKNSIKGPRKGGSASWRVCGKEETPPMKVEEISRIGKSCGYEKELLKADCRDARAQSIRGGDEGIKDSPGEPIQEGTVK